MKNNKPKSNPLLFTAIAIAFVAVAIVLFTSKKDQDTSSSKTTIDTEVASDDTSTTDASATTNDSVANDSTVQATLNEDGDVVFKISDITEKATFIEYDSNGTTMGLLAVKASDGTIRTALNTCQVCNGSPYAYFEQKDDTVECQNCGNIFNLDMIEQERGGCNPVPIMKEDKSVTDTEITIPATFLEDNANKFENWKQF